jgi:hypothetical protein
MLVLTVKLELKAIVVDKVCQIKPIVNPRKFIPGSTLINQEYPGKYCKSQKIDLWESEPKSRSVGRAL